MTISKFKIKDDVVVITGRDKGKSGTITKIIGDYVTVSGIAMVSKTIKRNPQQQQEGGIIRVESKIHRSNIALKDQKTGKPIKIGRKQLDDGKRVRYDKRTGEAIADRSESKD